MQGKFKRINTEALNRSKVINSTRVGTKLCDYKQSQRNVLHLTIHLLVRCNIRNSNYPYHNAQNFSHDYLNSCVECIQLKRRAATYLCNQPTFQLTPVNPTVTYKVEETFPNFIGPGSSLPISKEFATGLYTDLVDSIPHLCFLFL